MSFFTGFGVSSLIYWGLNRVFPVIGAASSFEEVDVSEEDDHSEIVSQDLADNEDIKVYKA